MKRIIRLLFFVALSFTATGCLDMVEEISLNNDGSGTYVYSMDVSKLVEQLKPLASLDSTGQMMNNLYKNFDSTYTSYVQKYEGINGVSNVRYDKSTADVYKITLDFTNVDVLNTVVDITKGEEVETGLYTWSKGRFNRKDGGVAISDELLGDDENKEMAELYLKDMTYSLILHFPGKVKSVSNKNAVLSDNDRTVKASYSMSEIRDKNKSLQNEIKYK